MVVTVGQKSGVHLTEQLNLRAALDMYQSGGPKFGCARLDFMQDAEHNGRPYVHRHLVAGTVNRNLESSFYFHMEFDSVDGDKANPGRSIRVVSQSPENPLSGNSSDIDYWYYQQLSEWLSGSSVRVGHSS